MADRFKYEIGVPHFSRPLREVGLFAGGVMWNGHFCPLPLTLIFGLDLDFVTAIRLSFRPESERQRRRSGESALSDGEGNLLFCLRDRGRAAPRRRVKIQSGTRTLFTRRCGNPPDVAGVCGWSQRLALPLSS